MPKKNKKLKKSTKVEKKVLEKVSGGGMSKKDYNRYVNGW